MMKRKGLFSRQESPAEKPTTPKLKVANDCVVSIDYTIADDEGNILDTTQGRSEFSYLQGGNQLLPGLQRELEGKSVGDVVSARLLPKDAYGMHDPERIQAIERPYFNDVSEIEEGMEFEIRTEEGLRLVTVKHVDETDVTVDLNHPLAGKTLHVSANIQSVRPASEIEKKNNEVF